MMKAKQTGPARLPPDVTRVLLVKSLPFKITPEEMYDIFGKYGAIRQIRMGTAPETKGKAFVVYEDIYDAKQAVEHLNGFNVLGRYIVVLYHNPQAKKPGVAAAPVDIAKKREQLEGMKKKFGVKGMEE